jgi:hypothetical protein
MNVLIVEGKKDKAFIEYLINLIALPNVKVIEPPKIEVNTLGGLSKEALNKRIGDVIPKIATDGIEKIGIIIDLDTLETNGGFEKRLNLVNLSIKETFAKFGYDTAKIANLTDVNQFISIEIDDDTRVEIACFFIHLDDKGELEDLLRKIKVHISNHADCLEIWKGCLKSKGIHKTDKEINKLWLHYYIRYDICTLKEQEEANKYCNLAHVLNDRGEKLFDFNDKCLQDLKAFLTLFKAETI